MKGVVFITLAVNPKQLEHSVPALYGAEFDATVYLWRFVDGGVKRTSSGLSGSMEWSGERWTRRI